MRSSGPSPGRQPSHPSSRLGSRFGGPRAVPPARGQREVRGGRHSSGSPAPVGLGSSMYDLQMMSHASSAVSTKRTSSTS